LVKSDGLPRPPSFVPTPSFAHRFRFQVVGASTSFSVTRAMLLNLIETVSSATAAIRIIEAIRITQVELWGRPLSSFSSQTVGIEWVGTNAPSTVHSDTTMGLYPAYVKSRPPRLSSASWWSMSGGSESEVLMILTASEGDVIDLRASVRIVDSEAAVAGEAPVTGSTGVVYNYLDGLASGGLQPVGVRALS